MRTREVPWLATWLLQQLVTGRHKDSLLGDLFEEYQAGRTAAWYWRETLLALIASLRSAAQRDASQPFSCHARSWRMLVAQSLLLVWTVARSQEYRQHCPSVSTSLHGSALLLCCAGLVQIAIVLLVWLRPLRPDTGTHRSRLTRFSVTAFAAIGLGSGALTWADTASCAIRPSVCASAPVVSPCAPRDAAVPVRSSSAAPADP